MKLFDEIADFGKLGRLPRSLSMAPFHIMLARLILGKMTWENSHELIGEIKNKATQLLSTITEQVSHLSTQKQDLLNQLEAVDILHCAHDGLCDLVNMFKLPLNPDLLEELYQLHVATQEQLGKGGVTFPEAMEHLCRVRSLPVAPMVCYFYLPSFPEDFKIEEDPMMVLEIEVIQVGRARNVKAGEALETYP